MFQKQSACIFGMTLLFFVVQACTSYDSKQLPDKNQAIPLFLYVDEISLETYLQIYNQEESIDDSVIINAEQISRVIFNQEILEKETLSKGDLLSIEIIDDTIYTIQVDIAEYNDMLSISGYMVGSPHNYFYFSYGDGKVLATLEHLENNIIYSIKTNPRSNNLYLFKTPRDKTEYLECGGAIMPTDESEKSNKGVTDSSPDEPQVTESGDMPMAPDNEIGSNERAVEINRNEDTAVLFQSLEEISKEKYIQLYGENRLKENPITAVAERIGRAAINQAVLKDGNLKPGDRLTINGFDGAIYNININSVVKGEVTSIGGQVEETELGYMYLSVSENTALITIDLPEENIIYLLRFNPTSAEHYLFEAPMDGVKRLPD